MDGQVAKGVDPSTLVEPEQRREATKEGGNKGERQQKREAFSSYTRVTVTRRPDGVSFIVVQGISACSEIMFGLSIISRCQGYKHHTVPTVLYYMIW